MSGVPGSARAVVIGAGIVLLDKGPFPNPGGSTGHASNFIYPVDHSKEMTALTLDSMRQYKELDVFAESGGIEVARTEVLGIDVERGRVRRVRTDRGDIDAEVVVIACGVWSPRIARMAGAAIPLTPAVHQMIDVGPVPRFASATKAIEFPIVRDMDTNMYERQDGSGLEIGSYAHRPILHDPDQIPSNEEAALSPTELPFTQA